MPDAEPENPLNQDQPGAAPADPTAAAGTASAETPEAATGSAPLAAFTVPELPAKDAPLSQSQGIDLLRDVQLDVKIELGRSRMLVDEVLRLGEGSVVELDKLAGDPVDVFVNNRLVARGEVLVLNDNFCVRINDIVSRDAEDRDQR
jgi:flagellar motor switch protein FliN/FliY